MTDVPDLTAVVVTVRPTKPAVLPGHLGRAVQAACYRWLASVDEALAVRWHDAEGVKPYTCSTLFGGKRLGENTRAVDPEHTSWFRLTGLSPDISAALLQIAAAPPPEVELEGVAFTVERLTTDAAGHPWAGAASSEALAAPYLMARSKAPRRVMLELTTATSFKHHDRTMPLPLPDLVFGSLCDHWNAFSPVALSAEVRAYCESSVGISRFELRSSAIPSNDGGLQIGSIGTVTYNALHYDRYWMSVLGLLAEYAFYAGIGRGTTAGLGQSRQISRRER